jgi:hypothetical protein
MHQLSFYPHPHQIIGISKSLSNTKLSKKYKFEFFYSLLLVKLIDLCDYILLRDPWVFSTKISKKALVFSNEISFVLHVSDFTRSRKT